MNHPQAIWPTPTRPRLAVIGNGMAAMRAIEELLALAPGRYGITVVGAEPQGSYNRVQLSAVLAGDKRPEEIITHPPAWYQERGITLHVGERVAAIHPGEGSMTTASGMRLEWDRLIIATGARPLMPPLPGLDLAGIHVFRTMADVQAMLDQAGSQRHAVVVGGGVLGLEAAWGLRRRGMAVTVIHLTPWLMERQLDETAAGMLRRDLLRHGITCLTGVEARSLQGTGRVEAVHLSDGRVIPADMVVMAVGIRPETELARAAGLRVERGIVVDGRMRTSHSAIHALGECVEHQGQCWGLVMPLWEMASVLAHELAGSDDRRRFVPPALATRLKIPGIALFSAGQPAAANDHDQEVVHHDPERNIYRKLVLRRQRVVGAVLYGDVNDSARIWQWLCDGGEVGSTCARGLCLGRISGHCAAAAPLESLADSAVICHCNGVTKGAIVAAIARHGLDSLEGIAAHTRAGSGCGGCAGVVASILARTLGQDQAGRLEAESRKARRRANAFRLWHRAQALLMTILVASGLFLHFAAMPVALLPFEQAFHLHKWAGLSLAGTWGAFLGLTLAFGRRWKADLEGMAMFVLIPAMTATGLAFLWPRAIPQEPAGTNGLAWVAVLHTALATLVLGYLVHHLGTAPWRWWKKRKVRALGG